MTFNEFVGHVEDFEGFRASAYRCPAGVLTIGYGRTEKVYIGEQTYMEKEEGWLIRKLAELKEIVKVKTEKWGYTFNENELLALTDFAYNCGLGNLAKLTSEGYRDRKTIAEKMLEYNKAKGKALAGLTKRRKWESDLFKSNETQPDYIDALMWHKIQGFESYGLLTYCGYCIDDKALFSDVHGVKYRIPESILNDLGFKFVGETVKKN